MSRYDSHKHPLSYRLNTWNTTRINNFAEGQPKSMPCHVTKVDKDFIQVAFENQNNVFTLPIVRMAQGWQQYSREPTQVGDKGVAMPGSYYIGGVSDYAGGKTDFYPRGNLTTLQFHGLSHEKNPSRDYDQLTHMGGPNGWIVGWYQKQQQQGDQPQDQQAQFSPPQSSNVMAPSLSNNRAYKLRNGRTVTVRERKAVRIQAQPIRLRSSVGTQILAAPTPATNGTTSTGQTTQSSSSDQQQKNQTWFQFDKNYKASMQSYDTNHNVVADQQNKTVSMDSSQTIYTDPHGGIHYVGGNPNKHKHCKIMTECGPSPYAWARIG